MLCERLEQQRSFRRIPLCLDNQFEDFHRGIELIGEPLVVLLGQLDRPVEFPESKVRHRLDVHSKGVAQIRRGRAILHRVMGVAKPQIGPRQIAIGSQVQRIQLIGNQVFFQRIAHAADREQMLAIP